MPAEHKLFTIGYAGHDPNSFVDKLRQYGVSSIVDVRQNPVSRKKGFSKSRLSLFLMENGIGYLHIRQLGVPRELRHRLKQGECTLHDYFSEFRRYIAGQDVVLSELQELAIDNRACLLCLEVRPEDCHRTVVADFLAARLNGRLEVIHI